MNLFLAAVYSNEYRYGGGIPARYAKLNDDEKHKVNNLQNMLESYHYVNKQKYVDAMRADGATVFIDSGAFSAFTLGVEIDLPTYCRYLQENADIVRKEDGIFMASVLDGIGDPLKTYQNQIAMERLGVKPLPCFHTFEDERYLEYYIKNYDYITLGGMVGKSADVLIKWLDRIWDLYLTDGSGKPRLKVHAFGITSFKIMQRYPWYSVDSSSWIQSAAFGGIVTPRWGNIQVSDKSPARHTEGRHFTTLSEIEKAAIQKQLQENGFDYERLSTVYESRAAYNLWSYGEIAKQINQVEDRKFKAVVKELFE